MHHKPIIAVLIVAVFLFFGASYAFPTRLAGAESRDAKLDGQSVHYESHGKGTEALVFVHGGASNSNFWSRQIPAFASRTRVIAIDLPGHGKSDKPKIDYTMDLFARAVDAVLKDAGVERAVLVGHSMGTPVIREFYRKYPRKTLALVIVDGPLRAFGDRKTIEPFLAPLRGPDYKEQFGKIIDMMFFGPNTTADLRNEIKNSMLDTPQFVALSTMDGMVDETIWKQDKINVPVLAIMAKSPLSPADNEQFYRSIAPNMDYQVWDGVAHFLMMEKPKEFNDTLAAFLAKNGLLKK